MDSAPNAVDAVPSTRALVDGSAFAPCVLRRSGGLSHRTGSRPTRGGRCVGHSVGTGDVERGAAGGAGAVRAQGIRGLVPALRLGTHLAAAAHDLGVAGLT